ncbi:hypothetical protein A3J90_02790 [candidate division WOR-1 bacterium RIFOXYC2_FULL_37_10]|uniref:DUF7305 domain-containing protein n=1 Tax=candidate division WOR-1 bacterium RIFOXYB2_FULL_37_13 TaxID=1802579 RepID=A0A1F4SP73_UNCSA|nr:MAG: hypothetical protein A2246_00265 [candidate division WOR-1 bacterium RIFOXYA2_FULL_37_7]OGC22248.1 MAG: hypothetical protein A2310_01470 [candidate division WOR-1 bacterium RIFOXYB2_FULL_37_13]OGC34540.1 MAG: hypothetical protein A3J90_02790 [candidate division WOR-1 bacterium RIFOXYC2_FULL_37_10]
MKKNGFALIVAIFVVVTFAVIGVVAVSLISGESIVTVKDLKGLQALNLAEAGAQYAITSDLAGDSDWSDNTGFTKSLGGGSFTVTYHSQSVDTIKLRSLGLASGVIRVIEVDVDRNTGSIGYSAAFTHAIYASAPRTTLEVINDAHVYGDLYYNGDVVMKNNALILDGTLYSAKLKTYNNATVETWEVAPAPEVPTFDSSQYDNILAATNASASSNLVVQNNDSWTVNSMAYKSVTFKNNAKIYGSGTIVATEGNITIQNNALFYDDNITLIAEGDVILENNTNFKGNFKIYAHGDIIVKNNSIIPSEALFYTDQGDVTFDNNGHFSGSVLAPDGTVTCTNNTIIDGLIYADTFDALNNAHVSGSVVVNDVGSLSNNVIITYDPLKLPVNIPVGLGASIEGTGTSEAGQKSNWYEVF